MSKRSWLPSLVVLVLATATPAAAQEGTSLFEAVSAALKSHPSVVQAEAAARSAALSLRLAEIDHGSVSVILHATPASGKVSIAPWEDVTLGNVVETFDADGSASLSATVELPWGMSISGSYTAGLDLDNLEILTNRLDGSISQDLLHPGPLAPTAAALSGRQRDLRLARLRLERIQSDVAQQVTVTFLDLIERNAALKIASERLFFAERDLSDTRTRSEQGATSQVELLGARIAVLQQRNAITDARATLELNSATFFADLNLPPEPLSAPAIDLEVLRDATRSLISTLRWPAQASVVDAALTVLEARAALETAGLQEERTAISSLPQLSLSLSYSKTSSAPGLGNLNVSLTGSYTLFDGGRQAVLLAQAEEQVDSARRALANARSTVQNGLKQSLRDLQRAVDVEELTALQLKRARVLADQVILQHAAGLLSDATLADASLPLREAQDASYAAVHALSGAYLSLSLQLGIDLRRALAAIAA